jgi:hypothetical protein
MSRIHMIPFLLPKIYLFAQVRRKEESKKKLKDDDIEYAAKITADVAEAKRLAEARR